jgi:hypothetical protein
MEGSLNLPEGLVVRPAAAGDVDAITELIASCELDLDGTAEIDPGDVVMDFGRAGFDPATDCVLVLDGGASSAGRRSTGRGRRSTCARHTATGASVRRSSRGPSSAPGAQGPRRPTRS